MTDQALDILKLVLLGLLYLFFARVLWAVWSEVRRNPRVAAQPKVDEHAATVAAAAPPSRRRPSKGRGGGVARLVIIEPKARRGTTFPLGGEITIGRDPASTVRIDGDTFVSQHHAKVYDVDGQPMVEDLGSTNGSFHNGNRLVGARLLHPGDRIQVGYTVLEAQ
jgi:pSer/pThr/pTyr-binding forkhead associated (FHA) protein